MIAAFRGSEAQKNELNFPCTHPNTEHVCSILQDGGERKLNFVAPMTQQQFQPDIRVAHPEKLSTRRAE